MNTEIEEIADGIYRISTPIPPDAMPGGFTFNQFLIVDEEPLLFHSGLRKIFPLVREAVARVLPPEKLRYVGLSHVEADESGALDLWLEGAPTAQPVCSQIAAMVSVEDMSNAAPRALADGETLSLGERSVTWIDAPHLPHGMDCGYLFEHRTRTLLCGDLFAQPGAAVPAVTESSDAIWGPSEALRVNFAYAPIRGADTLLEKLAATEPAALACMHGSSFRGDGAALLRQLGAKLA